MTASGRRVGRYEIVDVIGSGGMGDVYLARDPMLDRTVVVKALKFQSPEFHARFAREARAAASITHPNIVTIYDVGHEQDRPFIAMEFVDGETLAELIKRAAPMTVARKLELMIELCAGLGHAHRNGIIHRDIKPANLMVSTEGPLKILDFGL